MKHFLEDVYWELSISNKLHHLIKTDILACIRRVGSCTLCPIGDSRDPVHCILLLRSYHSSYCSSRSVITKLSPRLRQVLMNVYITDIFDTGSISLYTHLCRTWCSWHVLQMSLWFPGHSYMPRFCERLLSPFSESKLWNASLYSLQHFSSELAFCKGWCDRYRAMISHGIPAMDIVLLV